MKLSMVVLTPVKTVIKLPTIAHSLSMHVMGDKTPVSLLSVDSYSNDYKRGERGHQKITDYI